VQKCTRGRLRGSRISPALCLAPHVAANRQGRWRLFLVLPHNSTPALIGPLNGGIYRRGIMFPIVVLVIIWASLFALFEVPARMIGTRLVRKTTPRAGRMGALQNFWALSFASWGQA
jgi:hypothetical protein